MKEFYHIEKSQFVDVPQGISYFKYPTKVSFLLNSLVNQIEVPFVGQLTKIAKHTTSQIHIDETKFNEFDQILVPRKVVLSFPILPFDRSKIANTVFYDSSNRVTGVTDFQNNQCALLNVGSHRHGVDNIFDEDRVSLQLCFDEDYSTIVNLFMLQG